MSKVHSDTSLKGLLSGVYVVETLAAAQSLLPQLKSYQSVVTQAGVWMGPGWAYLGGANEEHSGVLQREKALKQTTEGLTRIEREFETAQKDLFECEEGLHQLERDQEAHAKTLSEVTTEQANVGAKIKVKQGQLDQLKERIQHILEECDSLQTQSQQEKTTLQEAREQWQEALTQIDQHTATRDGFREEKQRLENALQQTRTALKEAKEASISANMTLQSLQAQQQGLNQSLGRGEEQLTHLSGRYDELRHSLDNAQTPVEELKTKLKAALESHRQADRTRSDYQKAYDEVGVRLQQLEKDRHHLEKSWEALRNQLESSRLTVQSLKDKCASHKEQVEAEEQTIEAVIEQFPEDTNEDMLTTALERTERRITRLGPINLAAITEFDEQSTRKQYLDVQHEDLTEALTILTNAINKIDGETKSRFKDTFDQVNEGFQRLFPKLFGGGQASLSLTDDDLLEAGVTVFARPPGKRNTSIHLLSGGEKALTAVALVFAIFQLNPAPFCLLDEVDAPLDDANVGRFVELVKEMSKTVQFLFISHNKLTIEMADHMVGVTMREPGVSRLVAVDIEEAVAMAE